MTKIALEIVTPKGRARISRGFREHAEAMEEAAIHPRVVQESHGARVAVGQNRLGTIRVGNLL